MSILFKVMKFCEEQRPCNGDCPIHNECVRMCSFDPCHWDVKDVKKVEKEIRRWKSQKGEVK